MTWVQEVEPDTYDPNITNTTATHTRKQMEQEWERTRETWAIRKGFLRGVAANFRYTLDKTGTPNSRAFTPPTTTQPPSKSSNISKHDFVRSMFKPRKIYVWHTTQSGTARSTSRPSENSSMTIRYASCTLESPSPTKKSYNFISNKCTHPTTSTKRK